MDEAGADASGRLSRWYRKGTKLISNAYNLAKSGTMGVAKMLKEDPTRFLLYTIGICMAYYLGPTGIATSIISSVQAVALAIFNGAISVGSGGIKAVSSIPGWMALGIKNLKAYPTLLNTLAVAYAGGDAAKREDSTSFVVLSVTIACCAFLGSSVLGPLLSTLAIIMGSTAFIKENMASLTKSAKRRLRDLIGDDDDDDL